MSKKLRSKRLNWGSQSKIAKLPISLDSPIELNFDEDEELMEIAESLEITGPDGKKIKLRHPRKSKLLEKISKENNES